LSWGDEDTGWKRKGRREKKKPGGGGRKKKQFRGGSVKLHKEKIPDYVRERPSGEFGASSSRPGAKI